jgi:hypothetical protein
MVAPARTMGYEQQAARGVTQGRRQGIICGEVGVFCTPTMRRCRGSWRRGGLAGFGAGGGSRWYTGADSGEGTRACS